LIEKNRANFFRFPLIGKWTQLQALHSQRDWFLFKKPLPAMILTTKLDNKIKKILVREHHLYMNKETGETESLWEPWPEDDDADYISTCYPGLLAPRLHHKILFPLDTKMVYNTVWLDKDQLFWGICKHPKTGNFGSKSKPGYLLTLYDIKRKILELRK
jgi:hypothetical protein